MPLIPQAPTKPVAGSTSAPAEIVHAYRPGAAAEASQVQSMLVPVPEPVATVRPSESVTVTVHGRSAVSCAWNSTGPPGWPRTDGAYSFGSPSSAAAEAIAPSRA